MCAGAERTTELLLRSKRHLATPRFRAGANSIMSEFKVQSIGLDRRGFLKSLGGGLLVLFATEGDIRAQESGGGHGRQGEQLPERVSAWLHIAPDGTITAYTGK